MRITHFSYEGAIPPSLYEDECAVNVGLDCLTSVERGGEGEVSDKLVSPGDVTKIGDAEGNIAVGLIVVVHKLLRSLDQELAHSIVAENAE